MSTLTIELDSLTENRLQERSLQEGRKKEELAAHLLARAARSDRFLTPQEIEWLRLSREELSDTHWKRYRKLGRKSKTGTISPEEYAELLDLGNQIEVHHAKRLKAVWELSQLWGCDFEETMKLLGVGPRCA
jgi:hypothetical protein